MNKHIFITIFLAAFAMIQQSTAQLTASVDCITNTVSVTGMPTVSSPMPLWTGAFIYQNPCGRVFQYATLGCGNGSNQPRYFLDRYNWTTKTWSVYAGPTGCPTSTNNLPHGTWRWRGENPIEQNGSGCATGHILVYNNLGQTIGYLGTYNGAPSYTSNVTVTGPTLASEVKAKYKETIGNLTNALFNYNEIPKIDTKGTINYDRYWVAIYELGGQNRSTGSWYDGFIPGDEINLLNIWKAAFGPNATFEPVNTTSITYQVQFAAMGPCNSAGWVEANLSNFGVCTSAIICRGAFEEQEVEVNPNPASSTFHLDNFQPEVTQDYRLTVTDLSGRTVKEYTDLTTTDFDVSDMSDGLYMVTLWKKDAVVKTFKLSVVK